MLTRLKALLGRWRLYWVLRNTQPLVDMITSPIEYEWSLGKRERRLLDAYMADFVEKQYVEWEEMVVDKERSPNLHFLVRALRGEADSRISIAAYDWVLHEYPEIKQLTEKEE
jgi:hypothetical protein